MFIKSDIPQIKRDNLIGMFGKYLFTSDTILIAESCPAKLQPYVIYHELAHASGHDKRTGRIRKLRHLYGKDNAEKIEEITADIIAMVLSQKLLGSFEVFSRKLLPDTLNRYYFKDIPAIIWSDVKAGAQWFMAEGMNKEQETVRDYVESIGIRTVDYVSRSKK